MAAKLLTLEDILEQISSEESLDNGKSKTSTNLIEDHQQISEVVQYLDNPYKSGIWLYKAKWKKKGAFTQYIFDTYYTKLTSSYPAEHRNSLTKSVVSRYISRISPTFQLFYLASLPDSERKEAIDKSSQKNIAIKIDWSEFKKLFSLGLKIYKEKLDNTEFTGIINSNEITKIGDNFTYPKARLATTGMVQQMSLNKDILVNLNDFFIAIDQIYDVSLIKIYSPEDDLFIPYFSYLTSVIDSIAIDHKTKQQILNAFNYFNSEDYIHCVSSLGRIAEDYLTQIYETFTRKPVAKSKTIGQIYDLLHNEIKLVFKPEKTQPSDYKDILNKIKDLNKNSDDFQKNVENLLRSLVTNINKDKNHTSEKIKDIIQDSNKTSIFPKSIQENFDELLRYRNAASHKTRVPIGDYESIKTLYCLYTIINWWNLQKENTDWSEDPLIILKNAVDKVS